MDDVHLHFSSPARSFSSSRCTETIHSSQGYTFEAESNGQSFTVRVPVGGVERGQKFSVPFLPGSNGYSGSAIPRASVPVGHWKVRFQYIMIMRNIIGRHLLFFPLLSRPKKPCAVFYHSHVLTRVIYCVYRTATFHNYSERMADVTVFDLA